MRSAEEMAAIADGEQFKQQQRASDKPEPTEMVSVVGREDGVLLVNKGGTTQPATNGTTAGLGIGETVAQGEGTYLEVISPEPFTPAFPVFPLVVRRRRFGSNNIIPFVYGVPHTFDYTYPVGAAAQEIESASQWLFSRDLQQVPVNCFSFIEIKYAGSSEDSVEDLQVDKVCTTFTGFWYQEYAALAAIIRASGNSPDFFYTPIQRTECEPPSVIPRNGLYLHNASFIEHQLKIGPLDNFLTYTETFSHGRGQDNRTAASFTTTGGDGDPNVGYLEQRDDIIHPDLLNDFEDRNTNIENTALKVGAGSAMTYSWTLSSSIDSISGSGIKDSGAASPVVVREEIPDTTPIDGLTPAEQAEFAGYGIDSFTEQDVLEGGAAYASTQSVQLPIKRINGTPYISSHEQIDFIAARQTQEALPALGGIGAIPELHDYHDEYLSLPYRSNGLADWLIAGGGNYDPSTGDLLKQPLRMPLSLARRLQARGVTSLDALASAFAHLVNAPPTLLIPNGPQEYCYQAWAQNTDDPANIFWELRDLEEDESDLDWRFPMQSTSEFAGPCEADLHENRFINIYSGTAYEVIPTDLAAVLANAGAEAVSVPFTGKALGVDSGACSIGTASGLSKSFPAIETIAGAEVLAAAPNRVAKRFAAPTVAP